MNSVRVEDSVRVATIEPAVNLNLAILAVCQGNVHSNGNMQHFCQHQELRLPPVGLWV